MRESTKNSPMRSSHLAIDVSDFFSRLFSNSQGVTGGPEQPPRVPRGPAQVLSESVGFGRYGQRRVGQTTREDVHKPTRELIHLGILVPSRPASQGLAPPHTCQLQHWCTWRARARACARECARARAPRAASHPSDRPALCVRSSSDRRGRQPQAAVNGAASCTLLVQHSPAHLRPLETNKSSRRTRHGRAVGTHQVCTSQWFADPHYLPACWWH